jgi:hypothetical protein
VLFQFAAPYIVTSPQSTSTNITGSKMIRASLGGGFVKNNKSSTFESHFVRISEHVGGRFLSLPYTLLRIFPQATPKAKSRHRNCQATSTTNHSGLARDSWLWKMFSFSRGKVLALTPKP